MTVAFSFVFPFLFAMALCQCTLSLLGKPVAGWARTAVIAFGAAFMVMLPIGGLPVARWLVSLQANTSITLTALLFFRVLENAFQIPVLDQKAKAACRVFSIVGGALLYPMALGLGAFDPYVAGWHFSWLFVLMLTVTLVLLFLKNRFSLVLLAAILAYDVHLLESGNLWDYLVDPILILVSVGAMLGKIWGRCYGAASGD